MTFPLSQRLVQKYLIITRLKTHFMFMGGAGFSLLLVINEKEYSTAIVGDHPTVREASRSSQR